MNELKEVAGQLIHDRPWHCSFCNYRYRRRVLIVDWFPVRDLSSPRVEWRRVEIRLCVRDAIGNGCGQMGFDKLFRAHRGRTSLRFVKSARGGKKRAA